MSVARNTYIMRMSGMFANNEFEKMWERSGREKFEPLFPNFAGVTGKPRKSFNSRCRDRCSKLGISQAQYEARMQSAQSRRSVRGAPYLHACTTPFQSRHYFQSRVVRRVDQNMAEADSCALNETASCRI
jgi:hypothetical protein